MIIVAAGCVEAERIGSAAGVDVPADGVLLFFFFPFLMRGRKIGLGSPGFEPGFRTFINLWR